MGIRKWISETFPEMEMKFLFDDYVFWYNEFLTRDTKPQSQRDILQLLDSIAKQMRLLYSLNTKVGRYREYRHYIKMLQNYERVIYDKNIDVVYDQRFSDKSLKNKRLKYIRNGEKENFQ